MKGSRTASVSVDSVTPSAPAKNSTITITGTVTNKGRQKITGGHIGVHVAPNGPLGSRSDISQAASRTGYSTAADGDEIPGHKAALPSIPAGISQGFTLDVPASALKLSAPGVYQLGVSLTGRVRSAGYDQVLGIDRTFLPWYKNGDSKRTKFTFLWPLIDRPRMAVRSDTDNKQSPIFLDDDLAQELAPGGRLQQMVALGKGLPVTWVIDPDLLATVEAMATRSYRVAGAGGDFGSTTPGIGSAAAKQWLYDLRQAVAGHEVVTLPFGDPDIASIAHRGKDVAGTLAYLGEATQLAAITVDTVLGVTPVTDVAWPVNGALDSSVAAVATAAGAHTIIARSDSLREPGSLTYTPTAARPVGGGTTAVVADSGLSASFQGNGLLRADAESTAVQEFLSQTLTISLQSPTRQRSILVAPQRRPTASQAQAMADAISTVQHSGWAQTVDFSTAAKAAADPRSNRTVPGAGAYPKALRGQELPTDTFQELKSAQKRLQEFRQILSNPSRVDTPFGTAMLRSMSTEWRSDAGGALTFRDAIGTYLSQLIGLVRVLDKGGTVTLSGRSATIPVSVKNELGQTITGLRLQLVSDQPNSLDVGGGKAQSVTVEGGHTRSLKFEAKASRNGFTYVTAQLYTKDGTRYGDPMRFRVSVTSITSTIMLVIASGLLLLVLAGVRMYRQRKRRAVAGDAEPDTPDEAESGAEHEGESSPEQPGDPKTDTDPDSTTPSDAGEKVDR